MKYSDTIIKEIAELFECGHLCFLEKKTGNIEYYPEEIDLFLDEKNPWQDIISKIESDKIVTLGFKRWILTNLSG